MIKNISKRFAAMLLSVIMVFTVMPAMLSLDAFAANVDSGIENVTFEVPDDTTYSKFAYSGGVITASAETKDGGCNGTDTPYSEQFGIINSNAENKAILISFNYSFTANSGKATITCGGSSIVKTSDISSDAPEAYSVILPAGESITVKVDSGSDSAFTVLTIQDIAASVETIVTGTFNAAANGSYTVTKADSTSYTVNSGDAALTVEQSNFYSFTLAATPASNYKFVGWNVDGAFVSTSANYTLSILANSTVEPLFAPSNAAVFKAGAMLFADLDDAIAYSQANSIAVISLADSGTISGNYTIPNGKTLLIPYDDINTCQKLNPTVYYNVYDTPSAYKTLTLADGASLTVQNGAAISVSAKLVAKGQKNGYNGCVGGKYGHIVMQGTSLITVKSGGTLYTYGYISGSLDSSVTVQPGGTVWELFQIRDWRGGSAATSSSFGNNDVFVINQYYVQNIETPLTVEAGATEKVYTSVNASSRSYPGEALFIGEGGMFDNKGGSIIKYYDAANDRLIVDIYGDMDLSPLSISTSVADLDTSEYVLPITNNMTCNVHSGTTSITQNLAFLPDAVMSIDNDAIMRIRNNVNVYVYDKESWGNFANDSLTITAVGYSVANGTTAVRTDVIDDATIDINGKLVMYGKLYTTAGAPNRTKADAVIDTENPDNFGAKIISSQGTGTLVYATEIGTETHTCQAEQSGTTIYIDYIPIEPAKLRNGAGAETAYTATTDGDRPAKEIFVYYADFDSWTEGTFDSGYSATFHFSDNTENTISNIAEFDRFVNAEGYDAGSAELHLFPDDVIDSSYLDNHKFLGWTTDSEVPVITGSNYAYYSDEIYDTLFFVDDETAPEKHLDFYPVYAETVVVTWENYDYSVIYTEKVIKGGTTSFNSAINGSPIQKPHTDEIEYYSYNWRYVGTTTTFKTTDKINADTEIFSFWPDDTHSYKAWTYNDEYHWKPCRWCTHLGYYGPHEFDATGKCTCGRLAPHPTTTVNGGATVQSETFEEGGKYWLVTVQAPMLDSSGNYFTYWQDQNGNNVGTYRTYSFYITEDTTLTPVYTAPSGYASVRDTKLYAARIVSVSETVDGAIKIAAEHAVSTMDSNKNEVSLNSHGFIATLDASYGNETGLNVDNEAEEVNVFTAESSRSARTGLFTQTMTGSGDTVYARAYVVDGNGEYHYGPVQSFAVSAGTHSADEDIIVFDGEELDLTETNTEEEPIVVDEPAEEKADIISQIIDFIKGLVPTIFSCIKSIFSIVK
ncbi:MAG: hypothetical protein IJU45_02180 [Clostridia bacterium]|nr:hypothetical protein [Clostridia bacterium]